MVDRAQLPLLAVSGGYGRVARVLEPLADEWRIRLIDRSPEPTHAAGTSANPPEPDESFIGDLNDSAFIDKAIAGADAVLHLAANASPESTWTEAALNVRLAEAIFGASERHRISRVVVASSVHANGGAHRAGERRIAAGGTPWPCCAYGASKVATEALARVHADSANASVVCLRLGLTGWEITGREHAKSWLGNDDAVSIVRSALTSQVHFGIYHAVSRYAAGFWSVDNALTDLGWSPQDELPEPIESLPFATWAPCRLFALDATVTAPQSGGHL